MKNVAYPSLIISGKTIVHPIHIKLGFFKNFVNAMDKNNAGFHSLILLNKKFILVSEPQLKEGIFVGP